MARKPHSKNSPSKEIKEFEEEVLQIDRVTRVVKGGRRLRFRATVVIGDRKGRVGVGVGKSDQVVGSIQKAIADAKKNLILVKLNGTTIPHDVKIKHKSALIILLPAAPGAGIIAGGSIRKVVELAGIKDILSKSFGTTNKITCSRATLLALSELRETPFMKKRATALAALAAKQPAAKPTALAALAAKQPAAKPTIKPAEQPDKPIEKKQSDKPKKNVTAKS